MGEERNSTPPFLREWREYRGLGQVELAERLGISHATVSRWETGRRAISLPMLQRLANELVPTKDIPELFCSPPGSADPQIARILHLNQVGAHWELLTMLLPADEIDEVVKLWAELDAGQREVARQILRLLKTL